MMSEKPIIFSTPMVQAILAGKKTQTRRVMKSPPSDGYHMRQCPNGKWYAFSDKTLKFNLNGRIEECKWRSTSPYKPKYQPGDILWVRETWACIEGTSDFYAYKADDAEVEQFIDKWKPSIHMPRAAARLFLKVVNVRCERLQSITDGDCCSEGMLDITKLINCHFGSLAAERYRELWDSLNAKRGYGWDTNPWVWVIEFERVAT